MDHREKRWPMRQLTAERSHPRIDTWCTKRIHMPNKVPGISSDRLTRQRRRQLRPVRRRYDRTNGERGDRVRRGRPDQGRKCHQVQTVRAIVGSNDSAHGDDITFRESNAGERGRRQRLRTRQPDRGDTARQGLLGLAAFVNRLRGDPCRAQTVIHAMPASPSQIEVTSGMRIVWRISANNAAASPTALASSMAVTGS